MKGTFRAILLALMIGLIGAGVMLIWLSRPKSPSDIVRDYLSAQMRDDMEMILNLTATSSREMQRALGPEISAVIKPLKFTITNQRVFDGKSTVFVVITRKGSYLGQELPTGEMQRKEEILLVREGDDWRVDTYATAERALSRVGDMGDFYRALIAPYRPK